MPVRFENASITGQVDDMFEDIARLYGGLDILVNNAGISGPLGHSCKRHLPGLGTG